MSPASIVSLHNNLFLKDRLENLIKLHNFLAPLDGPFFLTNSKSGKKVRKREGEKANGLGYRC